MNKSYHLDNYIAVLDKITKGISDSVRDTVEKIVPKYIQNFSCKEHLTGLLLGNVQSGKTGQIFGIIAASADEGFELFILLTTDNTELQKQTYKRALQMLDTFNVCDENDYVRFIQKELRQPTLVILKKNTNVLKTWKNNISSSKFCEGRTIFIIDDEADAASLNTKINQKDISAINSHLEFIQKLANSSIYLQVTATPQAILLQTKQSGRKPDFIHYFPPGKNYLGGDFFYSNPESYAIITTNDEIEELKDDSGYISDGLRKALLSFLVSSAHIMRSGGKVCNFLIHPSVSIKDHDIVADKIGTFLNQMLYGDMQKEIIPQLKEAWAELQKTKPDIKRFDEIQDFITRSLTETNINILIMNSKSEYDVNKDEGMNIIVGGNTLGRGVTFPALQTVYYCRRSKRPQADTFWQHCRMFGYDRDPALIRVFIPPFLLKLFTDLNAANSKLIEQVANNRIEEINLIYPDGINPTRKNVLDENFLNIIVGGIDIFASYPKKKHLKDLDLMLKE
ncbi:MAG: Z1 domain-containing protein, partial [Pseudomonadota bacterium]